MRKAILMMLLAGVSSSAAAKWVAVDDIETETSIVYADTAAIRKTGNTVKMWSLYDFNTFQFSLSLNKPYLSMRNQYEYDCKDKRQRMFTVSFHTGNMAQGEVIVTTTSTGNWRPVSPGTGTETLWKLACEKS